MWSLLLIGISLGLLDCLNPFTISTQVVLQPFVKKTHHVLYYIAGTFLSYLLGGVFVYWGIDKIIAKFWNNIMASHSEVIFSIEVVLGIGLVILGFFFFYRRIQKKKAIEAGKQVEEKKAAAPKSVNPVFLFFFGAANTIGDLPTAFPYLMFIAKIVEAKLSIGLVLLLLVFYCLVYIMPLLIIYVLYAFNKKKLERLIEKLQRKAAAIGEWATIVFPAAIGVFFSIHGCICLFP